MKRALLAAMLCLGLGLPAAAQEHGKPQIEESSTATTPDVLAVGAKLACDCGCPHEPVSTCSCGTAQRYRREIAQLLNTGMDTAQAFTAMIERYGPALLREPPDTPAGIFAKRILPMMIAVFGVVAVGLVMMRWRKRDSEGAAQTAETETERADDDEYLARVEDELKKL